MDNLEKLRALLTAAKAVIFDFDGVLADSERYHFLAYSEVFSRYGHKIDEKEYYKYWTSLGLGSRGEIERYGLDLDPVEIVKRKIPIFSRYCRDGSIKLYPEAAEVVRLLKRMGKRLVVASGSSREDILAVLENGGLEKEFEAIVGKYDVERPKPEPETFLRALEVLALGASDCVIIEDAQKGLQAALSSGIPVIIVKSRETRPFDFQGAELVLDGMSELLECLRKLWEAEDR